ncbi:MAG: BLUF domain-containing protein [Sphingomicrobium sp.]
MLQIAYFSSATEPQTSRLIHDILTVARAANQRDDISGLLVAGGGRYMQVIEGPGVEMKELWRKIRADTRHYAVTELVNRRVLKRCFDGWDMAFRREPRLGDIDTFPDTLRFLVREVEDKRLRGQIEIFARSFILHPAGERTTPWDAQPSTADISEALPPAAVVSTQVTRSVAKRAT